MKSCHAIWLLGAPIYYFTYKRAALRISDPRFYEDIDFEQRASNSNVK